MNYIDANFAIALHFNIRTQTELAAKFIRRNSRLCLLSDLAELECRRAFIAITGRIDSEPWIRFQTLISEGVWRRETIDWKQVFERSVQLTDRYGARFKSGILDTVHIAQALFAGATWFLSFDTNSNARVLAAKCGLKVYPQLTAVERVRLR